jgi:hypothetical protein
MTIPTQHISVDSFSNTYFTATPSPFLLISNSIHTGNSTHSSTASDSNHNNKLCLLYQIVLYQQNKFGFNCPISVLVCRNSGSFRTIIIYSSRKFNWSYCYKIMTLSMWYFFYRTAVSRKFLGGHTLAPQSSRCSQWETSTLTNTIILHTLHECFASVC